MRTKRPTLLFAVLFSLPPMTEMGVQVKKTRSALNEVFEFYDSKTKHALIYQYSPKHVLESIEIRDSMGMVLEKTRFLPHKLWKQTPGRMDEWITLNGKKGIHRYTQLTGKKLTYEYPFEESLELSCSDSYIPDGDMKQFEGMVKDLSAEVTVHIGNAKVKSTGCDAYPKGEMGLVNDIGDALKVGSKCMVGKSLAGINSPETRDQGIAIRAFFENPETTINLVCAKSNEMVTIGDQEVNMKDRAFARSWIPPKSGSPGILVNMSNLDKLSTNERKGMLFHEMLHWLGILHNENFDTPYIATQCCMADDVDEPKAKKACELLNLSPRPEVDSKLYLNQFTEMMLMDKNPMIPLRTIQRSAGRKLKEQPLDLSAQYEANQQIKKYGDASADVYSYALKKMDPKIKDEGAMKTDTSTPYEKAVLMTGDLVVAQHLEKVSYEEQVVRFEKLKSGYRELLAQSKDEAEKAKLMRSIHQWGQVYSAMDGQFTDTDTENARRAKLWTDLEKDL